MRSDIKHIGIGLLVGGGVAAIAITGFFFAGFLQLGSSSAPDSETVIPS